MEKSLERLNTITISVSHEGSSKDFTLRDLGFDRAVSIARALRSGALEDLIETGEANSARLSCSVLRELADHSEPELAAASLHALSLPADGDVTARARLTAG